jgi:hypothetical protein
VELRRSLSSIGTGKLRHFATFMVLLKSCPSRSGLNGPDAVIRNRRANGKTLDVLDLGNTPAPGISASNYVNFRRVIRSAIRRFSIPDSM